MAFQHTVLVTSPGGHCGSELVALLLQEQVKLILPTSNASRIQSKLPPTATKDNTVVVEGSIKNPKWVESTMRTHSVDAVFLCLTGTDELLVSLNFIDAMKRVPSVRHLVYLSVAGEFTSDAGLARIMTQYSGMNVLVKPPVECKLKYGNFPFATTVLGPTLFFDNDLRTTLQSGVYDEPLGRKGVSRVSTKDIAAVARNAILSPDKWAGKKICIGSKRMYTGTEIAELWSKALGKPVQMVPANEEGLEECERTFKGKIEPLVGKAEAPAWARVVRLMYEAFDEGGIALTDEEYKLQVECLGREPEDYEAFVAAMGKSMAS